MNVMTKLEMANLVLSEDKKANLKDLLCSFYGAKDVQYRELPYGIGIDIKGPCTYRFVKNAIINHLSVTEETISVLGESEKDMCATYVYMPEKDKNLQRKLKKNK